VGGVLLLSSDEEAVEVEDASVTESSPPKSISAALGYRASVGLGASLGYMRKVGPSLTGELLDAVYILPYLLTYLGLFPFLL
jgi:hypothetical protein